MCTKSFLIIAMDLLDRTALRDCIAKRLYKDAPMVPRTTVHSRSITFSPTSYTLLTEVDLLAGPTEEDAHRLVMAGSPLLSDHFSLKKAEMKIIQERRPRLTRSVRNAIGRVRSSRTKPGHLVAIACITAVYFAEREGLLKVKPNYTRIYRCTRLSRYVGLKEIVCKSETGRIDVCQCRIILDRVVIPRRPQQER